MISIIAFFFHFENFGKTEKFFNRDPKKVKKIFFGKYFLDYNFDFCFFFTVDSRKVGRLFFGSAAQILLNTQFFKKKFCFVISHTEGVRNVFYGSEGSEINSSTMCQNFFLVQISVYCFVTSYLITSINI